MLWYPLTQCFPNRVPQNTGPSAWFSNYLFRGPVRRRLMPTIVSLGNSVQTSKKFFSKDRCLILFNPVNECSLNLTGHRTLFQWYLSTCCRTTFLGHIWDNYPKKETQASEENYKFPFSLADLYQAKPEPRTADSPNPRSFLLHHQCGKY